jgi:Family of unknown function (DUF5681)
MPQGTEMTSPSSSSVSRTTREPARRLVDRDEQRWYPRPECSIFVLRRQGDWRDGRLMTETTVGKQNKPWQFQPGRSGNPKGRPKGCRHRATVAAEALLNGEAEGLTRKAIELALAGDATALRLCLERILPARKDRPVRLQIPEIEGVQDLGKATAALLEAVATGELTPAEAGEVAKLVEVHRRTVETVDLEERLRRLEAGQKP